MFICTNKISIYSSIIVLLQDFCVGGSCCGLQVQYQCSELYLFPPCFLLLYSINGGFAVFHTFQSFHKHSPTWHTKLLNVIGTTEPFLEHCTEVLVLVFSHIVYLHTIKLWLSEVECQSNDLPLI